MAMLKAKTKAARRITKYAYFKYDEEDKVVSFNKREFLEQLPKYKLEQLTKLYHISKRRTKYSVISDMLKRPDIDEQILLLIDEDKAFPTSDEDWQYLDDTRYKKP